MKGCQDADLSANSGCKRFPRKYFYAGAGGAKRMGKRLTQEELGNHKDEDREGGRLGCLLDAVVVPGELVVVRN